MMNHRFLGKAMLLSALTLAVVLTESVRAANVVAMRGGDSAPVVQTNRDNKAARLVSLADSLAPLQVRFNMHADKPRLVAILSPT